ncbi:MAG TPA: DUF3488 domain-containing protein, partial [Alteromonas mediterranea]|nr:DUF3488 domain-containing protein [Alteromonas mediterranea]
QTSMLEDLLGALSPQKMRVVFLSAIGLTALILALYFLPRRQTQAQTPSHRALLKAIKHIESKTKTVRGNKSLSAFRTDVSPQLNSEALVSFNQICEQFERENYASQSDNNDTKAKIKHDLRKLKKALQ